MDHGSSDMSISSYNNFAIYSCFISASGIRVCKYIITFLYYYLFDDSSIRCRPDLSKIYISSLEVDWADPTALPNSRVSATEFQPSIIVQLYTAPAKCPKVADYHVSI